MSTKTVSVPVPKNLEAVNTLLGEVGAIDNILAHEREVLEGKLRALRDAYTKRIEEHVTRRAEIVRRITTFAKKNRNTILPDDRKSVELIHGVIGWRFDPWKVVIPGEEETLITWLETNGGETYLRYHVELNREQLLTDRPVLPGVRFEQKERFYIEPKVEPPPKKESSVVSLVKVA